MNTPSLPLDESLLSYSTWHPSLTQWLAKRRHSKHTQWSEDFDTPAHARLNKNTMLVKSLPALRAAQFSKLGKTQFETEVEIQHFKFILKILNEVDSCCHHGVCTCQGEKEQERVSSGLSLKPRKVTVTGCRCVWVPGDPGTSASCFGILLTCFPSSWLGIGIHYLQPPNSESIYSFNPIYKWLWVKYCKGSKWNTSGEKRECGPVHTVSCVER